MLHVPQQPSAVYLHIGPPKTGTTYLQQMIWANRATLVSRGVALPGARPVDHFHAALDLRGIEFGGHPNPEVPGAWRRLVAATRSSRAAKVVISHEVLAGSDEDQVARVASDLAPAEVHVVYGARDLARQLPAVWQESLKNRRSRRFDHFLDAALQESDATVRPRRSGFWQAQDAGATLRRWSTVIPPDRIHVLTVPRSGSPPATLWERFAACLDIEPSGVDLAVRRSNPSLTFEDTEVLRRLNKRLSDDLPWPVYERIVKARFNRHADERPTGTAVRVPRERQEAILARARRTRDELSTAGFQIVGDLEDLIPQDDDFAAAGAAPAPDPDKVADAAVTLLAVTLTERSGRLSRRSGTRARAKVSQWGPVGTLRRARGRQ